MPEPLPKTHWGGLAEIQDLPKPMRSGTRNKARLAEILFERDESPWSVATALGQLTLTALQEGLAPRRVAGQQEADPGAPLLSIRHEVGRFVNALVCLYRALCHPPLVQRQIELRWRTGLDQIPEAADIEEPPPQTVAGLLTVASIKARENAVLIGSSGTGKARLGVDAVGNPAAGAGRGAVRRREDAIDGEFASLASQRELGVRENWVTH